MNAISIAIRARDRYWRERHIPVRSRHMSQLVVAVAYDRLCTFEFGCVVEVFGLPRPELGASWYRFAVCAAERGPIRAMGGFTMAVPRSLRLLDRADTIIIPGWRDPNEPPPPALLDRLRAAYRRGARICSICSGVFVLAAAGLLDGRPATTHWRYARLLTERYPAIALEIDALYVDDGQLVTSAGSAAGLDMMLHLVRRDHGARVANLVAQRLVIPPHRAGDQAQFVPRPVHDEAGRLARLIDWVRSHPAERHTLASLARRAAMSTRTLQRQFHDSTRLSPTEWLIRERVAIARDLLASGRASMSEIAERTGFGSEESFRRHFRRIAGTSPSLYRKQFSARAA
ncbi:MAG TPA: transcriptional regulator FtrA [Kofleriaceae bacterium]|nr:transcriptional regulator FtrA [Kofleriaceae bacterium]